MSRRAQSGDKLRAAARVTTTHGLRAAVGALAMALIPVAGWAQALDLSEAGAGAARSFYLRAGLSLDWSHTTRFTDEDCASTAPPALYGCGRAADGAPRSSLGDFGTATGFEFGLGYLVAPAVRVETWFRYHRDFSFTGRANFSQTTGRQAVTAELSSWSGLFSAYLDLTEAGLLCMGPFQPFIGAGLGLTHNDIAETRMDFPRTTTFVPGAQTVDFSWMLTAGLALPLGERVTLDAAWRYLDAGHMETGADQGRIVWRDGSRPPLPLDLAATGATLSSHGLSLSLRYAF